MNIRPLSVIAEPVTLAQAKLHVRLDDDGDSPAAHPDDDLISKAISDARGYAEGFTDRALAIVNYLYRFSGFDSVIALPRPPLISVESVEYLNDDADWIEVDPAVYYVYDHIEGAEIHLKAGQEWPEPGDYPDPVRVTFQAGYSDGDSPQTCQVPEQVYRAIVLLIGHYYENRENSTDRPTYVIEMGAKSLLRRYRIAKGMA